MAKKPKLSSPPSPGSHMGIDSLPDDVLGIILSLVTIKEAARTSILSRRWRYVWLNIPKLDFSVSPETMKVAMGKPMDRGVERHKFILFVNQVIAASQGRAPSLVNFRVKFYFDARHSGNFGSWVQFAAEKGAQCIELNCFQGRGSKKRRKNCSFPVLQPRLLSSIGQLKSLSLDYVDISSEQLVCLLSTCKLLEVLRVWSSRTLTDMKVDGTNPLLLKSLDISSCPKLKSFVISVPTPDLVSLHCRGSQQGGTKLYLECAPRLVDLLIGGWRDPLCLTFPSQSNYFAQLESLHVPLESRPSSPQGTNQILPKFPKMENLKHLTVLVDDIHHFYGDLYEINSLIIKAPFLQHLTIHACRRLQFHVRRRRKSKQEPLLHDLQVVEYVGFCGSKGDEKLILHLLQTAVSPEKLIIDFWDPAELGQPGNFIVSEKLKKSAMKFGSKLPEGVQLVLRHAD